MTAPRRVLITGASGFTGRHLSRLALAQGSVVFGWARRADFPAGVAGATGDITDGAALGAWIARCQPDWIFHLAAAVHGSTPDERDFQRVNVDGTATLLEQTCRHAPAARVLVVTSSSIYAPPAEPEQPLDEAAPIAPLSAYGRSKAAQDQLAAECARTRGLHVVRARPFNQCGPGEPAGLVCGALARQLARIEAGLAPPVLRPVTLRPRRDFCDVRDVAAACWTLLAQAAPGAAANVCSGAAPSIAMMLDHLLAHATVRDLPIIETTPVLPAGALRCQIGDATRLRACGWAPQIPLAQSLGELLADWRGRIRAET
jgi:GDP-4-dehydro-6-deoxy-D-mannose reductase